MFVQVRKTVETEGNADKVVARFSGEGLVKKQEGFIDSTVPVKRSVVETKRSW